MPANLPHARVLCAALRAPRYHHHQLTLKRAITSLNSATTPEPTTPNQNRDQDLVDFLKSHGVSGLRPATAPKQLAHSSFLEAIKATCPLPFQIGVDICDISRIQKLVQSSDTFYQRFRDRVLTPLEVELQFIPEIRLAEFLAGRWAAKEAIIKAKASWQADGGTKEKVFMHDIVILPGPIVEAISAADVQSGEFDVNDGISKDDVRQQRGPLRAFVRQNGKWKEVLVSVSHDGEMATAMAFVVKD